MVFRPFWRTAANGRERVPVERDNNYGFTRLANDGTNVKRVVDDVVRIRKNWFIG